MKKRLFLLLGLIACLGIETLSAQELVVGSFERLMRDTYAQKNKRRDKNDNLCAVVRISAANAQEYTFEPNQIIGDVIYGAGEIIVYLPQNSKVITIHSNSWGTKTITFATENSEIPKLESGVTYRLELKLILPEDQQRRTLVMANVGYFPSQLSFGAMVGMAAKHGAYLHIQTDFGSATAELECDDTGALLPSGKMPYYKNDVSHKARFAFTGGYLYRFVRYFYGYVGAGYGYRTLAWETVDRELVENVDHSVTGVATEVGLIGTYKRFTFSVGCQALNFKYPELTVGFGYFF